MVTGPPKHAVSRTLSIIHGPPLGLSAKCELYSVSDLSMFPSEMKRSKVQHLEILGAPIGDAIFCGRGWVCGSPSGSSASIMRVF